jgi:hypothetical protein
MQGRTPSPTHVFEAVMVTRKPPDTITNTVEYRMTRRALQKRFIRKKPCTREKMALENAARMIVRSQFAAVDPSITPDMLCKLSAAARHAHALLVEMTADRRKPSATPPLRDLRVSASA